MQWIKAPDSSPDSVSAEFGSKSTNQKRSPVPYEVCIFLMNQSGRAFQNLDPFVLEFSISSKLAFFYLFIFLPRTKNGESRDRRIKSPISGMSDIGD